MDAFLLVAMMVGGGADGPNLWGALGCAVAYAGALLAAVDGIGDFVGGKGKVPVAAVAAERAARRLKFGSKLGASTITVASAGIVLVLDSNWFAVIGLTLAFAGILLWSFLVYRGHDKTGPAEQPVIAPVAPADSRDQLA